MKRFSIVLSLWWLVLSAHPVDIPELSDLKSLSLGRVRALSEGTLNPSFLSFLTKKRFSFSVVNHYQIKELNTFGLYTLLPNPILDASIQMAEFGYDDFQQWRVQAGLSKKIFTEFSVGINLYYKGVTGAFEGDFPAVVGSGTGMNWQAKPNLRCAVLAESILVHTGEKLFRLAMGCEWAVAPDCDLLIEYATNFHDISRLSLGIDYELLDTFTIRAGCYTQRFTPTFGLSFPIKHLIVELACDRHDYLGYHTGIGLSYEF